MVCIVQIFKLYIFYISNVIFLSSIDHISNGYAIFSIFKIKIIQKCVLCMLSGGLCCEFAVLPLNIKIIHSICNASNILCPHMWIDGKSQKGVRDAYRMR